MRWRMASATRCPETVSTMGEVNSITRCNAPCTVIAYRPMSAPVFLFDPEKKALSIFRGPYVSYSIGKDRLSNLRHH